MIMDWLHWLEDKNILWNKQIKIQSYHWHSNSCIRMYAISAYHHLCYEFESRSGWGVQHYVIKIVIDLRQVSGFLRVLRFPPPIKLTATIYVDSGIKQHQTNKHVPDSVNTKFQCPVWSPTCIMWNLSKQNPE
jgi:hypothetical protein